VEQKAKGNVVLRKQCIRLSSMIWRNDLRDGYRIQDGRSLLKGYRIRSELSLEKEKAHDLASNGEADQRKGRLVIPGHEWEKRLLGDNVLDLVNAVKIEEPNRGQKGAKTWAVGETTEKGSGEKEGDEPVNCHRTGEEIPNPMINSILEMRKTKVKGVETQIERKERKTKK